MRSSSLPLAPRATTTPPAAHAELRRTLGFWELFASGVGLIVGAGIYVLVGEATAEAGAAVWLSFVMAAGLSALTAVSYCELATMYPRAAAEYEYTSHAFPHWVAFLVGWVMIAALVIAAAAVSLGFARYASAFFDVNERVLAVGLIAVVSSVAFAGVRRSSRLTILLCAVQVAGLLAVIAVGVPHLGEVDLTRSNGSGGVLAAAALVFFAFIGFDEVTTLSEEARRPARSIPLALMAALGLSAVLYVAVAMTSVSVLGAAALGGSERPLADVLETSMGSAAGNVVAVIAIVSTTNTTLLALTAASRIVFGMARDGALPSRLAEASGPGSSPVFAIAACGLAAAAFALFGQLKGVAAVTDVAIYLVFLATNATLIILRFKQPTAERPFRSPISIGRLPLLPVLGSIATVVMMYHLEREPLLIAGLVAVLGMALFGALSLTRHPSGH